MKTPLKIGIFALLATLSVSCIKEDECASKTFCLLNSTGAGLQVTVSGDYSKTISIADGGEECLDLSSSVEKIKLSWDGKQDELFLDQCYTEYTLK